MSKTKYEQERDENVRNIQKHFMSLGILVLAQQVRDVFSKKEKGKPRTVVSDIPDSDIDYDPSSDIDNSDNDHDSDDLNNDEVNTKVGDMVPGTRPQQKKQKAATTVAASQQPPRTPIRLTRQSAVMPSPGGRPPPKQRQPLPPKNPLRANPKPQAASSASQLQPHLSTSGNLTTNTTNTVPTTPKNTMQNPMCTPTPNAALSWHPTPTTSVTQPAPNDTSPCAQSSRQSNDINETANHFDAANSEDHFDAANSEGHMTEGDADAELVLGNKMPIRVAEGKKRPDVPLQAAKLATETGVALRDQLPIYTSWKKYQKEVGPAEVQKVLDKVATRLDVEVERAGPAKAACTDIVKKGVQQQRYHLKRKYFDPSLTLEQMLAKPPPPKMKKAEWTKLEKCEKNKVNRGQVQLHQRTGSRSYVAHRYSLRPKYNGMEPDPIQFFGKCMTSPQNGRTPLADDIYEQMVQEMARESEEGEAPKSPTQIVADSLSQLSRSSTFLPNIGLTKAQNAARSITAVVEARLQSQFEATLQAEREQAARKQEELQEQLRAQQASLEENQNLMCQTQEEVKEMHSKFEETNALLRAVLKLQKECGRQCL
nr:conserved hypothetical protein [Saccharum hybrid cultivar R570]